MRLKRTLVISLIVLVALGAVGFISLQVWLQVLGIDEPAPDDSDLLVEGQGIPKEDNAFHWLRAAADRAWVPWEKTEEEREADLNEALEKLSDPDLYVSTVGENHEEKASPEPEGPPSPSEIAAQKLAALLAGTEYDEAFAQEVLEKNRPVFEAWERAVACDQMQVPWELSAADGHTITDRLDKLLRLKGTRLLHLGETNHARDLAMQMIAMGHRWEGSHGSLPGYWHGRSIKASGVSLFEAWADNGQPAPKDLCDAAERLAGYGANEEGLKCSLRVQYMLNIDTLQRMLRGETALADIGPISVGPDGWRRTWPEKRFQPGWAFRRNETKRWMAHWYRMLIEQVGEPYDGFTPPSLPPKQERLLDVVWTGNTYGVIVCRALLPPSKRAIVYKCRENTWMSALRTRLALEAYTQKAGRLPEQLTQLMPTYLDALPVDDFDGQPLQYDAKKRIIYSVGQNLKDEGGMTDEEIGAWWKEKDPWKADEGYEPPFWDLPDPSWPVAFQDEAM